MTIKSSSQSRLPFGKIRNELIVIIVLVPLIFFINNWQGLFFWERQSRHSYGEHVSCLSILKQMDGAKQQWAEEHKQLPTAVPAVSDLIGPNSYIRSLPRCPQGGTYSLNAVSVSPTCSKSGAPDFHTQY